MARAILGFFDNRQDAQDAVQDLTSLGIRREQISIISGQAAQNVKQDETAQVGTKESKMLDSSTGGAVAGGVAGALVGLAALAIPGIGPVLAAGPLLAFFGGAAGSVAGGFIGAFAGWGLRDNESQEYAEGIRRGGTLVAVETLDERAADVLKNHHAVDIAQRAASWRSAGWTGESAVQTGQETSVPRGEYQAAKNDKQTLSGALNTSDQSLRAGKMPGAISIEDAEAAFRDHYQRTYGSAGHDYTYYHPAYQFGYGLSNDERYADKDWTVVEADLRRYWQAYNQAGSWEDFTRAVQFARDFARGRAS